MRGLFVALLAAVCPLAAPAAFVAGNEAPAADAVAEAIRQAKDAFHAPSDDELAQAKARLAAARDELAAELALLPNGESTGEETGLDGLVQQLSKPQPEPEQLDALERIVELNRASVKGEAFNRLRASLTEYLQLLRSATDPEAANEYGRQTDELERAWQAFAAAPSDETAARLHEPYYWLARHGQAKAALGEVRRAASHPNHVMSASAQFVDVAVDRDVSQPITNDQTQEGTRISVRGEIKGKIKAGLDPDPDKAALRVHFHGLGRSKITARKKRVTVHARGQTWVEASEVVHLSERGTGTGSPTVKVRHGTTPYAVSVNRKCALVRKLVGKLAMRVAWKQKAQGDRQAAAKTRRQVDEQLRTQSAQFVREVNRSIDQFGIFALLGPKPSDTLRFATTERRVHWTGHYASPFQFAAPTEPPPVWPANAYVVVQLHESAVNNTERLTSGRTASEADFRELVFETFGLVPNDDGMLAGREPAFIELTEVRPVTMRFEGGLVHVTLRLASVRDGRETFDTSTWSVKAAYHPQLGGGGVALVRGPLTVEPADDPHAERVKDVLSRFLVERANRAGPTLAAQSLARQLQLGQLTIDGGWLTLAIVERKKSE